MNISPATLRPRLSEAALRRVRALAALPEDQLSFLGEQGRDKKIEKEGEEVDAIRKKHRVN